MKVLLKRYHLHLEGSLSQIATTINSSSPVSLTAKFKGVLTYFRVRLQNP